MKLPSSVLRCVPWIVLAAVTLWSAPSMATCSGSRTTTIQIPTLVVPRDAPIGSLLAEGTSSALEGFKCTGTIGSQQLGIKSRGTASGLTTAQGAIIYRLAGQFTGLGYAILGTGVGVCPGVTAYDDGVAPLIGSASFNKLLCDSGASRFTTPISGTMTFQLYKIADSVPGGYIANQLLAAFILRSDNAWAVPEAPVYISAFNVSVAACTVNNKSIVVPMGTVNTTDFAAEGSTAGTKGFEVPLSCDANTKVNITLNAGGAGASDSARGILNLDSSDSASVASGVKLQMLYNDAPLVLNTPIQTGTTPSEGAYIIPFKARYYRTAGSISAGQANASATLTISYQ